MRLLPLESAASIPAYLVLLRVGFTLRPRLRGARCALTAPFHPYLPLACASGLAVRSLLHWPSRGLEPSVPDVIRHTALRSSDFPPPRDTLTGAHGSDHPAACSSSVPRVRERSPLPYLGRNLPICNGLRGTVPRKPFILNGLRSTLTPRERSSCKRREPDQLAGLLSLLPFRSRLEEPFTPPFENINRRVFIGNFAFEA